MRGEHTRKLEQAQQEIERLRERDAQVCLERAAVLREGLSACKGMTFLQRIAFEKAAEAEACAEAIRREG